MKLLIRYILKALMTQMMMVLVIFQELLKNSIILKTLVLHYCGSALYTIHQWTIMAMIFQTI